MSDMGYAMTVTIVYGVKISETEAKQIYDETEGKVILQDNEVTLRNGYYELGERRREKLKRQYQRGHLELLSNYTDSRIDSLVFDEGREHVFGVVLARNGYACDDDLTRIINADLPSYVEANWSNHAVKLLSELGIVCNKPELHIVQQII